ncbi:MAG TPA: hypothetical protein VI603_01025 [Saprospiraceae bacterium]|nr:hypothetical protein [Saprospiraceae bacterium]
MSDRIISESFIFDFASRENLEKDFIRRINPYSEIMVSLGKDWLSCAVPQYFAHRIFRPNGLIRKYIGDKTIRTYDEKDLAFLEFQRTHPWRFCFSEIRGNPSGNFFKMTDVFSGEDFLLYSPAIGQTLQHEGVMSLWFNLIFFNGECWQTFSMINWYQSFDADDIFYYASEINPKISSEEDLIADLDKNPVPYMMLFSASGIPRFVSRGMDVLHILGEHTVPDFDVRAARRFFEVKQSGNVYELTFEEWREFPHMAQAYFDKKKKILLLSTLTDQGYAQMISRFSELGVFLPEEPDVRVHMTMLTAMKKILKKKIRMNPYEQLFEQKSSPGQEAELGKINNFLQLAMKEMNAGRQPNVEKLAKMAGVDVDTAREILAATIDKFNEMKK